MSVFEAARRLGYDRRVSPDKVPFNSHGQPAFFNEKDYITPDVDGHNVSNGWKKSARKVFAWEHLTKI
ncbi:hypothetical protein B7R74_12855 [Yersinia pseudotuberculosis]|nr:hypothetical protein B7R74_12855 [Yersinia pseudotuberculosis]